MAIVEGSLLASVQTYYSRGLEVGIAPTRKETQGALFSEWTRRASSKRPPASGVRA